MVEVSSINLTKQTERKKMQIQQDQRGKIKYTFSNDDGAPVDVHSITGESSDVEKCTVDEVIHESTGVYIFYLNWVALGAVIFTMEAERVEDDENPLTQEVGVTLVPDVAESFGSEESVEELPTT